MSVTATAGPSHRFSDEFQGSFLVRGLGDEALQHLAFVIDGPPEVMSLAVDLHEHLIQMPPPVTSAHALDAVPSDLAGEDRAEPVSPEPHRFVADIDAAFVEQVLDVPQRQREADVHHHGQSDDLGAGLEVPEGAAFGHGARLSASHGQFKPTSFDSASWTTRIGLLKIKIHQL